MTLLVLALAWLCGSIAVAALGERQDDQGARAERAAAGLRKSLVYDDEKSDSPLTTAQHRSIERRYRELDVPVYVVRMELGEELGTLTRRETFLQRLYEETDREGLYLLVDTTSPDTTIDLANHGAKVLDHQLYYWASQRAFQLPEERADQVRNDRREVSEPHADRGPRIHRQLMEFADLVDNAPPGPPGRYDPYQGSDPDSAETSTSFADGLWRAGWLGVLLLAFALVAGALVLRSRRQRGGATGGQRDRPHGLTASSQRFAYGRTRSPSVRTLRRSGARELGVLQRTLQDFTGDEAARDRAWDCLDLATLLLDQRGEQRITADVRACDLSTALVLIRLGQTVLETSGRREYAHTDRLCLLNPLHDVASHRTRLRLNDAQDHDCWVCSTCHWELLSRQITDVRANRSGPVRRTWLRLPRPGKGRWRGSVPYHQHPGALGRCVTSGAAESAPLVREVRRQLGVHR